MTAPPFALFYPAEAHRVVNDLAKPAHAAKLRGVRKTLRLLRDVGASHPGLSSQVPLNQRTNGEEVWESYVENPTPGAWRIWWVYGPEADVITIVTIGPHP